MKKIIRIGSVLTEEVCGHNGENVDAVYFSQVFFNLRLGHLRRNIEQRLRGRSIHVDCVTKYHIEDVSNRGERRERGMWNCRSSNSLPRRMLSRLPEINLMYILGNQTFTIFVL